MKTNKTGLVVCPKANTNSSHSKCLGCNHSKPHRPSFTAPFDCAAWCSIFDKPTCCVPIKKPIPVYPKLRIEGVAWGTRWNVVKKHNGQLLCMCMTYRIAQQVMAALSRKVKNV